MPPKFKFREDERVLCYHGPLIYEARVQNAEIRDKVPKYFVHYNGWNKTWDEWVSDDRIMKYTEENLKLQKTLQKTHKKGRRGTYRQRGELDKLEKSSKLAESHTRKKRVRLDPNVESEAAFLNKIEVKIKIPDELKPCLVDDWDLVNRQKKVVKLPVQKTASSIIEDYVKSKLTKGNSKPDDQLKEFTIGLKDYFNAMLGSQLLYSFERPQYADILKEQKGKAMIELYGAVHLLRLFVRLGSMLAYTSLDEKAMQSLLSQIHDFLKFLVKNSNELFTHKEFVTVPPEYFRKS